MGCRGKGFLELHRIYYGIFKGRTRVRKGIDLGGLGMNNLGKIEG